jgi:hypothetical protein
MKNFALLISAAAMLRIEQVPADFLLLNDGQMSIGKLHFEMPWASTQEHFL